MNTSIPLNQTSTPCGHFIGKVSVGACHVASFAFGDVPVPLSMAEIFERTRGFLAVLDGTHFLVSLNWHNFVQVLGVGDHCEAVLKATVVRACEVDRFLDPDSPVEFRRAVKMLFALDMNEAQVRAELYELAQAPEALQTLEMPDVGSKCVNA